jgi:site-specific recombinase XerD
MSKEDELQEHFSEFIEHKTYYSRLRPASIRAYQNVWKHFTQQMPEVTKVSDLNPRAITVFLGRLQNRQRKVGKEMKRTGIKDSTVQTYGRKLHDFFDWLVIRGVLENNPVDKSALPKPNYTDKRALGQSEIERIMVAVIQNSKSTFLKRRNLAVINVLLYTGIRRGELLGIKVTDIDFHKGVLRVEGTTSKSKRDRYIPLNRFVLQSIEEYIEARKQRGSQCEYLWVSDTQDSRFTEHGLKHLVKRIVELSGVKFHVHRFRHSFATALAKDKNNIVLIQGLMGHSDLRSTQTYLRSMGIDDLRDSIDGLSLASFG